MESVKTKLKGAEWELKNVVRLSPQISFLAQFAQILLQHLKIHPLPFFLVTFSEPIYIPTPKVIYGPAY
jgi:hypothetical protein